MPCKKGGIKKTEHVFGVKERNRARAKRKKIRKKTEKKRKETKKKRRVSSMGMHQ